MLQTFKVTKKILAESARLAEVLHRGEVVSSFTLIHNCAIALALKANKEVFEKYPELYMGVCRIYLGPGKGTIEPKQEVIDYMHTFDCSHNYQIQKLPEFEFTLDIPD